MALIKCPECGKEISDRAQACIHCGCPINKIQKCAKIKMPLFPSTAFIKNKKYAILDKNDSVLWSGEIGQMAEIDLDIAVEIKIKFLWGLGPKSFKLGRIEPGKVYQVTQDSIYGYNLSEIDFVDSI